MTVGADPAHFDWSEKDDLSAPTNKLAAHIGPGPT